MITDYQNEYFKFYQLFKGNYYKGVSILRGMLSDPALAKEVVKNKAAIAAIYADATRSVVDKMCADALNASAYAVDGAVTYINVLTEKTLADISALTADQVAMDAVVVNVTVLAAFVASATAMNAVAASATAMNAVVASATAMNAVAASATAMNAVVASATAMNAVVASATAMNAVAASATAMNAVVASATAMNAVAASATAMNAVAASATAMNAVNNSNLAIGKYVAKLAGLNPVDYADMNAVVASATAMNAVVASATAMNAVLKTANARTAIAGYPNLNSLYNTIMTTINNATYFSKKYDYIDGGSKRAIPGSATDATATANQSIFLCKKAGAWSDGTYITAGAKHLQTGVLSGNTAVTTLGGATGYGTDDTTTKGVPLQVVCIGGATIQETADAYISGIFAYAI